MAVDGKTVEIEPGDVDILEHTQTDLAMASGQGYVAALDTEIDDTLRSEGLAREVVNRVQRLRREAGLEVSDRIRLSLAGAESVERAAREHTEYISAETLAVSFEVGAVEGAVTEVAIDELNAAIGVERANG